MVALLVVVTVVGFLVADGVVQWSQARSKERQALPAGASQVIPVSADLPQGLFLDENHTWLELLRDASVQIGVTPLIAGALGSVEGVIFPEKGSRVKRGDVLFSLKQGKKRADFVSPIDGVVESVNEDVPTDHDGYDNEWICRLMPSSIEKDIHLLKIGEEAQRWLRRELDRLQDFVLARSNLVPATGAVAQDGGVLQKGVLNQLDEEAWKLFSREFLGS